MTWCVLWVLLGVTPAVADDEPEAVEDSAAEDEAATAVPTGTVDDPVPGGRERPVPGTRDNPLPGGRGLDLSGTLPGTVDDPLPGGRAIGVSGSTPGTVDHPIPGGSGRTRVDDDHETPAAGAPSEARPMAVPVGEERSVRVGVSRARGDEAEGWRAQWRKIERVLLDLEDQVVGGLDRTTEELGLASGRGVSVGMDAWRVDLEVLESEDDRASYRVRVHDDEGVPAEVGEAWLVSEDEGAEPRQLEVAAGSEVIIEDLSVHESAAVQIHVGDGDVVMVWIDEAAEGPAPSAGEPDSR